MNPKDRLEAARTALEQAASIENSMLHTAIALQETYSELGIEASLARLKSCQLEDAEQEFADAQAAYNRHEEQREVQRASQRKQEELLDRQKRKARQAAIEASAPEQAESFVNDLFKLIGQKQRALGRRALHSKGWNLKPIIASESRRIYSAHAELKFMDDGGIVCDAISYAEHDTYGNVINENVCEPDKLVDVVMEDNSLVLASNPALLLRIALADTEVDVMFDWDNPCEPHFGKPASKHLTLTVAEADRGTEAHTRLQLNRGRGKRQRTCDVWEIERVVNGAWPIREADGLPNYQLTVEAVSGYLSALSDAGLRGENGDGAIRFTPAAQTRAAYLGSFYNREEHEELIVSPSSLEDFYRTGRMRYMSPEFEMPAPAEYHSTLYAYDLKSAYLNIMRIPMPAKFIRSFKPVEHETLGWLRDRYRNGRTIWIAELSIPELSPESMNEVEVKRWCSNSPVADFDSLYSDDLIPDYVSVWEGLSPMRRFAEHLISVRETATAHGLDNVARAVKLCSVSAHQGLGYIGNSYLPVRPGSELYKYCESGAVAVNREPDGHTASFKSLNHEYLNQPRVSHRYQTVYGVYDETAGMNRYFESVPQRLVDNSAPHLGGWCLMACSARLQNVIAAAEASGGRVVWRHTDGIRSTRPILLQHYPLWLLEDMTLLDSEVEHDICLWPDGTRMKGEDLEAKPGTPVAARDADKLLTVSRRYEPGRPLRWSENLYDDILRTKRTEKLNLQTAFTKLKTERNI